MNQPKEMCCLCLKVLDSPLNELCSKSKISFEGLTHLDKISSSLSQLATVLNTLGCSDYKICEKCCDNIEMVYKFNQACLHNVRVYSLQNECFKSKEKYNDLDQAGSSRKAANSFDESRIKNEMDDSSNLMDLTQSGIDDENDFLQKLLENSRHNISFEGTDPEMSDEDYFGDKASEKNNLDGSSEPRLDDDGIQIFEFPCTICDKLCDSRYILKQHMQTHSDIKRCICEVCGKLFKTLNNLNTHLRLVHGGEKTHVCEECGMAFSRKIILYHHSFTHGKEKPLACDMCDSRFIQSGDLIKHRRIHTGERPYQCEICAQAFTNVSNLIKHKRVHTGDKPYSCDICKKTFTDQSSQIRHKQGHLGNYPYVCEGCNKGFFRKQRFDKHVAKCKK